MTTRVAVRGNRALAYVVCGEDIILVGGNIVQGSPDNFAEGSNVSRVGDRVQLGCGKVGRIMSRVARRTLANGRRVGLFNSGVTGAGIIRGWVTGSTATVYAG